MALRLNQHNSLFIIPIKQFVYLFLSRIAFSPHTLLKACPNPFLCDFPVAKTFPLVCDLLTPHGQIYNSKSFDP